MATKQVIEIDVTWTNWKKMRLDWLLARMLEADIEFDRLNIREVKKK